MSTPKQAAAYIRKALGQAREAARSGGHVRYTGPDGATHDLKLPHGDLTFSVRATKTGVNVEVQDGWNPTGYVDVVTGGDRSQWRKELAQPVIDAIEAWERFVFGKVIGKVEFGLVILSVTPGTARTIGAQPSA